MSLSALARKKLRWLFQNIESADEIISAIDQSTSDLTGKLSKASNLSDLQSPVTARSNLGLGSAALQNTSAFDSFGSAASSQAFAIQRSNHTGTQNVSTITGLDAAMDARITAQKGQLEGIAPLDSNTKIPASYLYTHLDDVLEFANLASFPVTGETGKIYVSLASDLTYRWSGSVYVEISPSPGSTDAVTEGAINLYHTTARASAASPVQSVAGRAGDVVLVKADVGLGNVDNTSDLNKPISTAMQTALNLKINLSEKDVANGVVASDASNRIMAHGSVAAPTNTGSILLGLNLGIRGEYNGSTQRVLGEPDLWLPINANGTIYKLPLYL